MIIFIFFLFLVIYSSSFNIIIQLRHKNATFYKLIHHSWQANNNKKKIKHKTAYILYKLLFSRISRARPSRKFPLQFMSIYSNDNIRKIAKLTTRELPQKSKNAKITVRENNGLYSIQKWFSHPDGRKSHIALLTFFFLHRAKGGVWTSPSVKGGVFEHPLGKRGVFKHPKPPPCPAYILCIWIQPVVGLFLEYLAKSWNIKSRERPVWALHANIPYFMHVFWKFESHIYWQFFRSRVMFKDIVQNLILPEIVSIAKHWKQIHVSWKRRVKMIYQLWTFRTSYWASFYPVKWNEMIVVCIPFRYVEGCRAWSVRC